MSTAAGWMPIAAAALDTRGTQVFDRGVEVVLLPAEGGEPVGLVGDGARVWRHLVGAEPVDPDTLTTESLAVIGDLAALNLAAFGTDDPLAVRRLDAPWLSSPVHELVYAHVARVAESNGIPCVFIKGPPLREQGLRDREHSGDVDVWCDPRRWVDLIVALEEHGWRREPDPWWGTAVGHSATLSPERWGCQIDVHRRMPGMTLDDDTAFARLQDQTVPMRAAGVAFQVPAAGPHAVVTALHAARPEIGHPGTEGAPSRVAIDLLRRIPDPVAACARLGAVTALHAELVASAPGTALPEEDGKPRDWFWRAESNRARAYVAALHEHDLRNKIRVALRLLWPTADVALESARRAGDSSHRPLSARIQRVRRGVGAALSERRRRSP